MPLKTITNRQKADIRAQHALKPYLTHIQLAEWFRCRYKQPISRATVCRSLSSHYAFLDSPSSHDLSRQRRRTGHWPELETALFEWIQRAEGRITISQEVIREKAKQYWARLYPEKEMPQFSNGWVYKFQVRNSIKSRVLHGENGDLSPSAAVEMIGIRQALGGYASRDIFNCDETGLSWRFFPERSLTTGPVPGRKKQRARITAHFCCNADASERLPI
jgi:hypothetical protein